MSPSPSTPPAPVRRRWSDALASAGLFGHALQVRPDTPADLFRRAELALLSGDHATAIRLLKEMDGEGDGAPQPAVALMLAVARTFAGEPEGWTEVQAAAPGLAGNAWTSWLVALAAASANDLTAAGQAAGEAVTGGCRDPRLISIAAAASVVVTGELSWEIAHAAAAMLEPSRKVALPAEDPLGATLDILARSGHRDRAGTLAAHAAEDDALPPAARDAWRRAGAPFGVKGRRLFHRGGGGGERRRRKGPQVLTCRCWGSAGWIGAERDDYVEQHLEVVDTQPVPALPARLLICRLTRLRFLDLPAEEITLPVDRDG